MNIPKITDLRARPRIDLVAQSPIPAPLTIYLETTNVCNFRCVSCPESLPGYAEQIGQHMMTVAQFESICDQILELGPLKTLNFWLMGEPFANRHLTEMIEIAKRRGVAETTMVATNGTLAHDYKAIVHSGLDYIRFSIYGGNDSTHSKRTKSKVPLYRIKENLANIKYFRDLTGADNPAVLCRMLDYGDVEVEQYKQSFAPVCDSLSVEQFMNWNDPIQTNLSGMKREDMLQTQYFANKKEVCPIPFFKLAIHSDLTVSACCVDWDKKTALGNLKTETLAQIWRGERLQDFRLAHLRSERHTLPGCSDCTYLHTAFDNIDRLTPEQFLREKPTSVDFVRERE